MFTMAGTPIRSPRSWHRRQVLGLALALVALASPTASAQEEQPIHARFEHVAFSYDPTLAAAVSTGTVPEQRWDNDWASQPEHVRFTFHEFAGSNDSPEPAEIRVYPTARYAALSSFAAGTMDALRRLLADRPDLRRRYPAYSPVDGASDPQALEAPWELFPPLLPWSGAATIVTAHPEYVTGEGVAGIRYLAQLGQNHCWTGSRDVTFYTFQGFSADGAWYVSARFPVRVPFEVPEFQAPEPWDQPPYTAACDAANASLAAALEATPAEAFTPSLHLLDALVLSIRTGLAI